jgi:hypothetical protein
MLVDGVAFTVDEIDGLLRNFGASQRHLCLSSARVSKRGRGDGGRAGAKSWDICDVADPDWGPGAGGAEKNLASYGPARQVDRNMLDR